MFYRMRLFYSAVTTWVEGTCVLPRGMPKRKRKDVLDMTKQCTLSFGRAQMSLERPEDEDDEDDGGESEGEDEDE